MDVGIPRELKDHEYRVAITPVGVRELTDAGHRVLVEQGAGLGSSITDLEFEKSGATVLDTADEVWGTSDLILKVKEPVPEEFHRLQKDQVLFTYLHLAASREVTEALLESGTTAVAYETVELADGRLPRRRRGGQRRQLLSDLGRWSSSAVRALEPTGCLPVVRVED